MRPVYINPAHSSDEPRSIVYDWEKTGLVRAIFYGDNRKADAEEFCRAYGKEDDREGVEDADLIPSPCTGCDGTGQITQDDGSDSMGTVIDCDICKDV